MKLVAYFHHVVVIIIINKRLLRFNYILQIYTPPHPPLTILILKIYLRIARYELRIVRYKQENTNLESSQLPFLFYYFVLFNGRKKNLRIQLGCNITILRKKSELKKLTTNCIIFHWFCFLYILCGNKFP